MRFSLLISLLVFSFLPSLTIGQEVYKITYNFFSHGKPSNRPAMVVFATEGQSFILRETDLTPDPQRPSESFFVDFNSKLFYRQFAHLNKTIATVDSTALNKYQYNLIAEEQTLLDYPAQKASLSVNSNAIDIWYSTALGIHAAPGEVGLSLGLVLEQTQNNNSTWRATKIEKLDKMPAIAKKPNQNVLTQRLDYQDFIWKSKFIQIPIFQNERIAFRPDQVESDSILRFAAGTVILKKVKIPEITSNSQAFIQLVEKSTGDAYDRTGSVFLIAEDQKMSFLDGMKNGMETLPAYPVAGEENKYLGMTRTDTYSPIYELMRFFTPFGVTHFNDRVTLKGKTWQDSVIYRQDISEFIPAISGKEVYIGTYIGNYDLGGHTVSLELTIHPGKSIYAQNSKILSLFNTVNVMEMGGQTYATLFEHEKGLEFTFIAPEDMNNVKLRYVTTGHGGWGNGDEFVPKPNSIYLDGKLAFQFTPWRTDCGSYRLYNPVSGNFENGLSSSDLSRSNWCPATVTNPIYIDLGHIKAGEHTIRIHIPQGPREGNSFSFWNVSGALLYD